MHLGHFMEKHSKSGAADLEIATTENDMFLKSLIKLSNFITKKPKLHCGPWTFRQLRVVQLFTIAVHLNDFSMSR